MNTNESVNSTSNSQNELAQNIVVSGNQPTTNTNINSREKVVENGEAREREIPKNGKIVSAPDPSEKMREAFKEMYNSGKFDKAKVSKSFTVLSKYGFIISNLVRNKGYTAVEVAKMFREGITLGDDRIQFNFSDQVFRNFINQNVTKTSNKQRKAKQQ